jgi:hypothetical protein
MGLTIFHGIFLICMLNTWRIFREILSVSQNIVMDLNNVMPIGETKSIKFSSLVEYLYKGGGLTLGWFDPGVNLLDYLLDKSFWLLGIIFYVKGKTHIFLTNTIVLFLFLCR